MVAKCSGISIGTVYNYFPTKGDLLVAVIEDFWKNIFQKIDFTKLRELDFLDALEKIYMEMFYQLSQFEENWLEQLSLLKAKEKSIGIQKEGGYFLRVQAIIFSLLDKDGNMSFIESLSHIEKEKLTQFIFDNFLIMLKKGEDDFSFFKLVLQKIMV